MSSPEIITSSEKEKSRRRRRLWREIVFVVLCAGGIACYFLVPLPWSAEIRLPIKEEEIPLDRFHHWNQATNPRTIATVTACFTRSTWITTEVREVDNGVIKEIANQVTGRSGSRIGDGYLTTYSVRFGLADAEMEEGHTTLITMAGATRSSGGHGGIHQKFEASHHKTFTGRISPGEKRLLYVEGNRTFSATPTTTPDEFAKKNPKGNFLVVSIEFER